MAFIAICSFNSNTPCDEDKGNPAKDAAWIGTGLHCVHFVDKQKTCRPIMIKVVVCGKISERHFKKPCSALWL
jgi:hypothetical protein